MVVPIMLAKSTCAGRLIDAPEPVPPSPPSRAATPPLKDSLKGPQAYFIRRTHSTANLANDKQPVGARDALNPRISPVDRSRLSAYKRCMSTPTAPNYHAMLAVAIAEARKGLAEGGIPIGGAIFDSHGKLIGSGHNRRVQNGDPSMHGETDAFRNAGRQRSYRNLIMVTTLAPCWYCSGLVRQFGFGTVVAGESRNFQGGLDWLRSLGIKVVDLDSAECIKMLADYIRDNPHVWNEDIGVD
jgi:cytosine/creatinine deaminase